MDLKLLKTGGWSFAGLLSLYAYTQAVDLPFAVHMLMFAAASVLMLYFTLILCIVFAAGYVVFYPAIPLANTATPGTLGWSRPSAAGQRSRRSSKSIRFKPRPSG